MHCSHRRNAWAIGYLAVLAAALVMPADDAWHAVHRGAWLAIDSGLSPRDMLADVMLNMAVFVPVGVLLSPDPDDRRTPVRSPARALAIAVTFSIVMETVQYMTGWRESSLVDVLSNVSGTALGIGGIAVLRWRRGRRSVPATVPYRVHEDRAA